MRKLQLQKGGIQGDAYKSWIPDTFQGILPGIFPQTALQCKQAMGALSLPWHSLSCKNASCYQWAVKQLKELTQTHSKYHQFLWWPCPRWQPFGDPFLTQCSVQEYCPLGTRGRLCCYSMQVILWGNFSPGKAEGLELLCQVNIADFEGQVLKKGNFKLCWCQIHTWINTISRSTAFSTWPDLFVTSSRAVLQVLLLGVHSHPESTRIKVAILHTHHVFPQNLVLPDSTLLLGQAACCTATVECLLLPSQATVYCRMFFWC